MPSLALEDLYTTPVSDSEETQRVRFEGAIAQYRAEHNAQAEVLAKYVFALATAIAARELSVAAERAALRVPVRPGEEPLGGKRHEVELTLRNP
jgi:hypothetical protein